MKFKEQGKIEIRFSGTGGQGLVLASIILAEALMMDGFNIITGESHGIEARGGASSAEIIASKGEIYDLTVKHPHIFVALSQESCNKYYWDIQKDGLVIIDSTLVKAIPSDINTDYIYQIPFTQHIQDQLGTVLPANIAFLGALSVLTDLLNQISIEKVIKNRVPKGSEEVNLKAFHIGMELAKEH